MNITSDEVQKAYKLFKTDVYYNNIDFFLKKRVADFEENNLLDTGELSALTVLSDAISKRDMQYFDNLLELVNFRFIPKKISIDGANDCDKCNLSETNNGVYITNVKSISKPDGYKLESLNYFIDAPIELHIIDTLWTVTIGAILDNQLEKNVYGNRIFCNFLDAKTKSNISVFKKYIDNYSRWRDNAIKMAKDILENHKSDVVVLSLDIEKCYYNINIDFEKLKQLTNGDNDDSGLTFLTILLEKIFDKYFFKIKDLLLITHKTSLSKKSILPIGLLSSQVLANWYIDSFDKDVINGINPAYYGRYVDDMLFVFQIPKTKTCYKLESIKEFVIEKFQYSKQDTLIKLINEADHKYKINGLNLTIQSQKLILHYFDKEHSYAGLNIFTNEINRNNSAFKLLPIDDIDKELDEFAYNLQYNGSCNKFRSIIGLNENDMELSKYLSLQIIAHRLSDDKTENKKVIKQLFLFFKGKNFLEFSRLWEKVFSFMVVKEQFTEIAKLYNDGIGYINQISYKDEPRITAIIKDHLKEYLNLSLSLPLGLYNTEKFDSTDFLNKISDKTTVIIYANRFRISNLIRHNYILFPLINLTTFPGNMTNSDCLKFDKLEEIQFKRTWFPRFIHDDEEQLLKLLKKMLSNEYTDGFLNGSKEFRSDNLYSQNIVVDNDLAKNGKLKVAIANIQLSEDNVSENLLQRKSRSISFKQQNYLFEILNTCDKEHVELLVMPELSIPIRLLPFLVARCRRQQIGLVFGLEHWIIGENVYNLLVTLLPYKKTSMYKSCIMSVRNKNYFSPAEKKQIEKNRLKPVELTDKFYERFTWKNINFATYNCFELADIKHRTLFKSEIDMLVACVWNKDTTYYKNILESVVRDLHCYVIQANNSKYGGSCVLQPTKSEFMTILNVTGGSNNCVLTADIDIAKLRKFQLLDYSENEKEFKPLPPGYDDKLVRNRMKF